MVVKISTQAVTSCLFYRVQKVHCFSCSMMFVFFTSSYLKVPIHAPLITHYYMYGLSFSTHLQQSCFVHICRCSFVGLCSNWQVGSGGSKTLPSVLNTQVSNLDRCRSKLIILRIIQDSSVSNTSHHRQFGEEGKLQSSQLQ